MRMQGRKSRKNEDEEEEEGKKGDAAVSARPSRATSGRAPASLWNAPARCRGSSGAPLCACTQSPA